MDEISRFAVTADSHVPYDRAPYLATHRALGACTRELARLSDELVVRAHALSEAMTTRSPVVRRPPGRCIIQVGPVALTVVWLRHALDTVAVGELMVSVWRGTVSPRLHHRSERPDQERAREPATRLWESLLTVTAADEHSWAWQSDIVDAPPMHSAALAQMCVDQLGRAYVNTLLPPEDS